MTRLPLVAVTEAQVRLQKAPSFCVQPLGRQLGLLLREDDGAAIRAMSTVFGGPADILLGSYGGEAEPPLWVDSPIAHTSLPPSLFPSFSSSVPPFPPSVLSPHQTVLGGLPYPADVVLVLQLHRGAHCSERGRQGQALSLEPQAGCGGPSTTQSHPDFQRQHHSWSHSWKLRPQQPGTSSYVPGTMPGKGDKDFREHRENECHYSHDTTSHKASLRSLFTKHQVKVLTKGPGGSSVG